MENLFTMKDPSAAELQINMAKPALKCYKCAGPYHYRIKRSWFLKYIFFFLPIKIYFCGRCVKNRYILLTNKEETKYRPV